MLRLRIVVSSLLACAVVACGDAAISDESPDAGVHATPDAGVLSDAGLDAGNDPDAGSSPDAGNEPDAGEPDAGADPVDGGDVLDGGDEPDGGESTDGGEPDAGVPPVPFGGDCTASFPGQPSGEWNHSFSTPTFVTSQGGPNHRIRDVVLSPGEAGRLRARFTYGAFDKDLGDEDVELWLRRCPGWVKVGTTTTDDDGIAHFDLPRDLPKGEWSVKALVLGDGTTANGVVAVWPAGTQAIVTDIDGTLTTSDWEAVQDVALGSDAEMYPDADAAMRLWASKGYRILFLTGRPQAVNRYSRSWLEDHAFPRMPMQLTDDAEQVFPTDSGVRTFKGGRLRELSAKGIEWQMAYGNATTDIDAYADAEIPKSDTWIIGSHAGEAFTQSLPNSYTSHLSLVRALPDASQP